MRHPSTKKLGEKIGQIFEIPGKCKKHHKGIFVLFNDEHVWHVLLP